VSRDNSCAVVTNRGWNTNAILGHVDPHSVTESACAGSHTQVFPTNLCGWYFLSSGVGCLYTTRSVSTRGRALRRVRPPKWTGSALHKAMWNSRNVHPQRHVEATGTLWTACCVWGYLPTVRRQDEGALPPCWLSGEHGAMSEGKYRSLIGHYQLRDEALIGCFSLSGYLFMGRFYVLKCRGSTHEL